MHAAGRLLAAADQVNSDLVPTLIAIAVALLGSGGLAAFVTAWAQRKNYVTTGYQGLTDASAKEAEQERQKAADERALRQRAEYMRDAWREAYYGVRDEAVAKGVTLMTRPPTEHPSEGTP
jgi:hypothetical protein